MKEELIQDILKILIDRYFYMDFKEIYNFLNCIEDITVLGNIRADLKTRKE